MNLLNNKQNLLSGVTVKKTAAPAGFYRLLSLQAMSVALSALVGFSYFYFLRGEYVPYLGIKVTFAGLCAAVFLLAFSSLLHSLLTRRMGALALLIVFEVLGLSFAFFDNTQAWWTAIFIAILAVAVGTAQARREMGNMVYLGFYRISAVYFSKFVLAIAVLAAVFYYPIWESSDQPIPKAVFDRLFRASGEIMSSFSLKATPDTTVEDFVLESAARQLEQDPVFQKLSPLVREKQIREAVSKMLEKSKTNFGLEQVSPDTKLSEAAFGYISQWIIRLKIQFARWFYVFWVVAVSMLIFGAGKIFSYLAAGARFILIQLILALKFIKVYDESSNKEIIGF